MKSKLAKKRITNNNVGVKKSPINSMSQKKYVHLPKISFVFQAKEFGETLEPGQASTPNQMRQFSAFCRQLTFGVNKGHKF